jgi:hypothetical protein
LGKHIITTTTTTTTTTTVIIWGKIWSIPTEHSHNAAWLRTEIANATIAPMTNTAITIQDVKTAIKKMNW